MKARHSHVPGIEWRLMDVRSMGSISLASVDVAFDKSTLDAMINGSPWDPPSDVSQNTAAYLCEVRAFNTFTHLSHSLTRIGL